MAEALRKERTEVLVGLFVLVGLAILGALILRFGRFSDSLKDRYSITVSFPDAESVVSGAPVHMGGVKVGSVAASPSHNEDYTKAIIPLNIDDGVQIPLGSKFSIATSGLMGDTLIKIQPSQAKQYVDPGMLVDGDPGAGLDKLQENALVITKQVQDVLDDIKLAIVDIRGAVQSLDNTFQKIENNLVGEENLENFKGTLSELKQSSQNIREASETLGPLLTDGRDAIAEAKSAFEKTGDVMETAKEVVAKAGPAVEGLEPAVEELNATLKNANDTINRIKSGEGAAAALISDPELRDNLERLIANLREHGILGYKDDAPSSLPAPQTEKKAAQPEEKEKKGLFNFLKRQG